MVQLGCWGWLNADLAGSRPMAWTWLVLGLCAAIVPAHYILAEASNFAAAVDWGRRAKVVTYHW